MERAVRLSESSARMGGPKQTSTTVTIMAQVILTRTIGTGGRSRHASQVARLRLGKHRQSRKRPSGVPLVLSLTGL
jgi:hypothetical protein